MTGNLILNADPTANLGAATKQYVDKGIDSLYKKYKLFSQTKTYSKFTSGSPAIDKIFDLPNLSYRELGFYPTKLYIEAEVINYSASNGLNVNLSENGYSNQALILGFPNTNTDVIVYDNIKISKLYYIFVETNSIATNNSVNFSSSSVSMPQSENRFNFGTSAFFLYHYNINGTVKVDAWLS